MSLEPNKGSIPTKYCNLKKINTTTDKQLEDDKMVLENIQNKFVQKKKNYE